MFNLAVQNKGAKGNGNGNGAVQASGKNPGAFESRLEFGVNNPFAAVGRSLKGSNLFTQKLPKLSGPSC